MFCAKGFPSVLKTIIELKIGFWLITCVECYLSEYIL